MTEELEYLKLSGNYQASIAMHVKKKKIQSFRVFGCLFGFFFLVFFKGSLHPNTSDKNWRNRRSQKLDKMELLNLQSSLQSEIQAKAAISEELSRTRADLVAAQKYVCN